MVCFLKTITAIIAFSFLEPIPKTDRIIAYCHFPLRVGSVHHNNKNKHTITRIPDELWDEIVSVLPKEKPENTVGRPIVPYRKVMDGIAYVLRTGCQWKMLPRVYGSGSTLHRRFQEWVQSNVFKRMWIRVLEEYDYCFVA
jgi:transposase